VTTFGEYPPIGHLLTYLGLRFKNDKIVANYFATFFHGTSFGKNGLGYTLGDSFSNLIWSACFYITGREGKNFRNFLFASELSDLEPI
jgi:hypothetical protein